jgi:hypothetical protein
MEAAGVGLENASGKGVSCGETQGVSTDKSGVTVARAGKAQGSATAGASAREPKGKPKGSAAKPTKTPAFKKNLFSTFSRLIDEWTQTKNSRHLTMIDADKRG